MNLDDLDTPCILVENDVVEQNIQRYQAYCSEHRLNLRPHIKTHKIPDLALRQLQAGAIGINCQKVSEAEVFVDAGIKDVLITFNILGKNKLERLHKLATQANITVVADNIETIRQLSSVFAHSSSPLSVLVECDTGAHRCGVQTPQDALALAKIINDSPGLRFRGLLTYPSASNTQEANQWLLNARDLCTQAGLPPQVISTGGTPAMYRAHEFTAATEYRVGTYIYNDRSLIEYGTCRLEDCALSVLSTVVSCPTKDRVVIDAGTKALTSDLLGMTGYGIVKEYPEAVIYSLSEEHGCIDFSACQQRPYIGEKLHIIPNHVCVVSNLFEFIYIHSSDGSIQKQTVSARGKVW